MSGLKNALKNVGDKLEKAAGKAGDGIKQASKEMKKAAKKATKEIKKINKKKKKRPMFCTEMHLTPDTELLADFLFDSMEYILQSPVEGLFRKSGSMKTMEEVRKRLDKGEPFVTDGLKIHEITSLLKFFFRELPGSLIPTENQPEILEISKETDPEIRNRGIVDALMKIPPHLAVLLKHMICMLHLLSSEEVVAKTKMGPSNFSLIFNMVIIHPPEKEDDGTNKIDPNEMKQIMLLSQASQRLVLVLIENYESIFVDLYPNERNKTMFIRELDKVKLELCPPEEEEYSEEDEELYSPPPTKSLPSLPSLPPPSQPPVHARNQPLPVPRRRLPQRNNRSKLPTFSEIQNVDEDSDENTQLSISTLINNKPPPPRIIPSRSLPPPRKLPSKPPNPGVLRRRNLPVKRSALPTRKRSALPTKNNNNNNNNGTNGSINNNNNSHRNNGNGSNNSLLPPPKPPAKRPVSFNVQAITRSKKPETTSSLNVPSTPFRDRSNSRAKDKDGPPPIEKKEEVVFVPPPVRKPRSQSVFRPGKKFNSLEKNFTPPTRSSSVPAIKVTKNGNNNNNNNEIRKKPSNNLRKNMFLKKPAPGRPNRPTSFARSDFKKKPFRNLGVESRERPLSMMNTSSMRKRSGEPQSAPTGKFNGDSVFKPGKKPNLKSDSGAPKKPSGPVFKPGKKPNFKSDSLPVFKPGKKSDSGAPKKPGGPVFKAGKKPILKSESGAPKKPGGPVKKPILKSESGAPKKPVTSNRPGRRFDAKSRNTMVGRPTKPIARGRATKSTAGRPVPNGPRPKISGTGRPGPRSLKRPPPPGSSRNGNGSGDSRPGPKPRKLGRKPAPPGGFSRPRPTAGLRKPAKPGGPTKSTTSRPTRGTKTTTGSPFPSKRPSPRIGRDFRKPVFN